MNSVYAWAGTLCAVLIIASFERKIAPGERTMKTISLVIGVYVVLVVTSPLVNFARNLDLSDSTEELFSVEGEASERYNQEVIKETGDYLAAYIFELLKTSKISPKNIEVVMGTDEERGIYIAACRIYIDKDEYQKEEDVKELISSSLAVEPSIVYE